MHNSKLINIFLTALILLTITVALLQKFAWHQTFAIDAKSNYFIHSITDSLLNNGNSTSSVSLTDDEIIFNCEIVASDFNWPFCELSIVLYDLENEAMGIGIDLSSFDQVKIFA